MIRFRTAVNLLLIFILILMPLQTAFAQDEEVDCGILGLGCSFIGDVLSFLAEQVRGFFDFLGNAVRALIDVIRRIGDFLVNGFRNLIQLIINLFRPVFEFIAAVIRFVVEVFQIIVMIIQIVVGFFIALGSFMIQAFTVIARLLTEYYFAPITAVPGLPQCVTAPTNYELCAFYYITDWTLFAPGTPGALLVPLAVIMLDITLVFFFIRRVLGLLSVGEKVTDV